MHCKAVVLSAFVAVAAAQSSGSSSGSDASLPIDPAMISVYAKPYESISGVPELVSFAQKYATVSNIEKFAMGAYAAIAEYTATAVTDGLPTPTGTNVESILSVLQTNSAVESVANDFVGVVGSYLAQETFLPKSAKAEMLKDIASVTAAMSGILPDTTGAADASGTGAADANASSEADQNNAAGRVAVGVSALVAGGIAVGAMLL
ncbi:hypothetical protein EDC01DRAFT_647626 [Geopyxis carbonaria]|nr:hypothetical protein EDC01DRAFT_647626 [Geopyxis carbonaria]